MQFANYPQNSLNINKLNFIALQPIKAARNLCKQFNSQVNDSATIQIVFMDLWLVCVGGWGLFMGFNLISASDFNCLIGVI